MADKLAGLKSRYKIWEFKNRTSGRQTIQLAGGDSVQVQANTSVRVMSDLFIQLPAFSIFLPVTPSITELIEAGIISKASEAKVVPDKPSEVADTSDKQVGGKTSRSS